MPWRDKGWSRIVFWLKITLPLAALALLSTLFLLSRSVDPRSGIPFTQVEIAERISGQQMTALIYSGVSAEGHQVGLTADSARPDPVTSSRMLTQNPVAVVNLTDGSQVTVQAADGTVDEAADLLTLTGAARLTSSLGYVVDSAALTAAMTRLAINSPGPITGSGPPGRFSAGTMALDSDPVTGQATLLFTGGVHLVYDPQS